jgi:4-carboxymuconolactone decarboxylase
LSDRLGKGREKFDELYGPGGSERLISSFTGLGRDLARYGVEFNFGDIYSRPGLSMGQRELLSLATLVALGGVDPQLRGHTKGALNVGVTPAEILETVVHTVQYVGFPRALNAMRVVTEALMEAGAEIPPATAAGLPPAG